MLIVDSLSLSCSFLLFLSLSLSLPHPSFVLQSFIVTSSVLFLTLRRVRRRRRRRRRCRTQFLFFKHQFLGARQSDPESEAGLEAGQSIIIVVGNNSSNRVRAFILSFNKCQTLKSLTFVKAKERRHQKPVHRKSSFE